MVHLQKLGEKFGCDNIFVFVIAMHSDREESRRITKELGFSHPVFDGLDSDLGELYAYG